jgi:hypothetical protein
VNVNSAGSERRKEPRARVDGSVRFAFDDPFHQEIEGQLVDMSSGGFRVAHSYAGLRTGQQVSFRHEVASGRARVMWNRILEERVETGFLVL